MIPLVDLHCHLLAGLDDGPRTHDDALAMCRMAYDDGIRMAAALAHQNERWKGVTPEAIRKACVLLRENLAKAGLELCVFPTAEVMLQPQMESAWESGALMSVADGRKYLLIEMPHGLTLDIRKLVTNLTRRGVRPILAHPERCPSLLHDEVSIEELIGHGCLVQVSSPSITDPDSPEDARALRSWFQRGIVHVVGSDAHNVKKRAPRLADAYRIVCGWAGNTVADRTFSTNGMAVLQGLSLRVPQPRPRRVGWLSRIWN